MNKNGEKLDKFCLISSGGTPSKKNLSFYENGSILWATIADMEKSDGIVLDTKLKITEKGLSSIGNRLFPKDTLFLAMYGSVGKVAIAGHKMTVNQAILGINSKNNNVISMIYLKYWLMHNKPKIANKARGGILKNLSAKIVKNLRIELPSYSEQIKIANLLTQVEALITKREESIRLLDELLRSSFLDMFGKYSILDYKLEELCSEIVDCPHSTPNHSKEKTDFLCLRTSEFSNGYIDNSSMKYLNEEEYLKRVKRLIPRHGDVIYAREGSYGDAVRVPKKSLICLGQRTMLFRPKIEICNSIFLWALVRSDTVLRQAKKKNKGATVGRVNVKDIKEFKVFLPPKHLQDKFATIVQQVEETKEQYQKSLDELRELFGSLSQRAFRGELGL